jgi:cytochrome c6
MRSIALCTILSCIALTIACGPTASNSSNPGNAASGQAVFTKYCADCHGLKGEGSMITRSANLKTDKLVSYTDEQMITSITNGKGVMPAFKTILTQNQINDVVKYIRHEIQGKRPSQ